MDDIIKNMFEKFFDAIKAGDLTYVESQLEADRSAARWASDKGVTALHWAVGFKKPEIIRLLINAGADVNLRDNRSCAPLHYAANFGRIEIIKLFISHGADLNAKTERGVTPLQACHNACIEGWGDAREILRQSGASDD